jgi:hypothetical protein
MILKISAFFGTVISTPEDAILFKHAKKALFTTKVGDLNQDDFVDFEDERFSKLVYPIIVCGGATTALGSTMWHLEERSDRLISDLQRVLASYLESHSALTKKVADLHKLLSSTHKDYIRNYDNAEILKVILAQAEKSSQKNNKKK